MREISQLTKITKGASSWPEWSDGLGDASVGALCSFVGEAAKRALTGISSASCSTDSADGSCVAGLAAVMITQSSGFSLRAVAVLWRFARTGAALVVLVVVLAVTTVMHFA